MALRVVHLSSVFEPGVSDVPARFDPIGGMQMDTGELSRALDRCGVRQVLRTDVDNIELCDRPDPE